MNKLEAIIRDLRICKEYQREPTRRSWIAVSKALTALGVTEDGCFVEWPDPDEETAAEEWIDAASVSI